MKDSTADSGVTSPPDSKPSKKDSEQIAVTPVGTVDEDTSEGSPAPVSGTATPDELPALLNEGMNHSGTGTSQN